MSVRKLQPVKSGSLRELVKNSIRNAIMQCKLLPGDPLREMELARSLRVSQATVREGLLQLENSGLVVRVPNKSTMVAQLSRQDLQERISVRVLLEGFAAVEASKRVGAAELSELQRRADAISNATARNDYFDLSESDLEFHRYLWSQSGNATLARTLDSLAAPLFLFISILRSASRTNLTKVVNKHDDIVTAVRQGDPELIRETIRTHVEGSYEEFLRQEWQDFRSLLQSRQTAVV